MARSHRRISRNRSMTHVQMRRLHALWELARIERLIFLICLVLPTSTWAGSTPALLEIYRSVPEIQEDFVISDLGDREELAVTSKGPLLPRQE